jgi:ElaB/YqjD/DUF883 family membrane-anchored ribosome-binding protein
MDERNDLGINAAGGTSGLGGAGSTPNLGAGRTGQTASNATSETERELERTRDMIAQAAAPVMAEKTQEAIEETGHRLANDDRIKNQLGRTAEAVKHDAERMVRERVGEVSDRLEGRANELKNRAADSLEDTARRLDDVADRHMDGSGGVRAQAGSLTHGAADSLESVSRYLRSHDVDELRGDLERQVRTRPLQTLLIGVAAGWLAGKILR